MKEKHARGHSWQTKIEKMEIGCHSSSIIVK